MKSVGICMRERMCVCVYKSGRRRECMTKNGKGSVKKSVEYTKCEGRNV